MAIQPNRFNDPALGAAFSNIASIFAPPSAQDMVGYTTAAGKKAENERLAWLFENANDPTADRKATMAGVYAPTSSYYAVDQNTATDRRGQDITANTALATNAADNTRALEEANIAGQYGLANSYMTPLAQGEVQPGLPEGIAGMYGMPEFPRAAGAAKPLSETEQKAEERRRLQETGTMTDTMLLDTILGADAPVKAVGPEGPVYMSPGQAARTGAAAYVDAGSQAAPENGMAMLADGSKVPAIQDTATGRWKHAQTGQELPADIQVYKTPAPTGTNEELGVGKTTANRIDQQLIDVAIAKDTATSLRDMIEKSPASQGAVGWLRGTTQNVIQTGGELGDYFGGGIAEVSEAIRSGAADANLGEFFDPTLPAIEMMANLLAFQYAKTTTGERLSNEMLRASKAALGLDGLTANQASSLARIDMAIERMEAQERILLDAKKNGPGAAAAAPAVTDGPQPGDVEDGYRFLGGDPADPASWEQM